MSKKKTYEELKQTALRYTLYSDFIEFESSSYVIARKRNVLDDICSHMKRSKIKNLKIEEIKQKALLFSKRSDFKSKYPTEYKAARRLRILKEVCSHMIYSHTYWTKESIACEAKKYENRSDFQKMGKAAYEAAKRRGREFLDLVCFHMKKQAMSSPEKFILQMVQVYFPNAKKFRSTNIDILDKPYLKSLEVDILVKELGKAIEFDGKYHHSLEGLKRGHPTWPDYDIANYHEIKDSWFLSKGIQILHIKEQDWIKNKEICIDKCLEFLGIMENRAA